MSTVHLTRALPQRHGPALAGPGLVSHTALHVHRGFIPLRKVTATYVTVSVGNGHCRFPHDCLRDTLLKYNLFVKLRVAYI